MAQLHPRHRSGAMARPPRLPQQLLHPQASSASKPRPRRTLLMRASASNRSRSLHTLLTKVSARGRRTRRAIFEIFRRGRLCQLRSESSFLREGGPLWGKPGTQEFRRCCEGSGDGDRQHAQPKETKNTRESDFQSFEQHSAEIHFLLREEQHVIRRNVRRTWIA